jgi:S-DNA-T family DNA segregation ATPase FtsK/SpoIIIE
MVGQNDDALVALAVVAGVALAAQGIPGADLVVIDSTAAESANRRLLEALAAAVPGLRLIRAPQIPDVMSELAAELRRRQETVDDPASSQTAPRFVFILGIQHFRALRQEDEFSFSSEAPAEQPAAQLKELLSEGPRQGIHLWIACDNYNNVSRFLGRKGLSEFGSRVLFQMGANDSASLIDHPGASRLGLHRALLHLEGEARFEIFRPYAAPDPAWLAEAQSALTSAARPDATGGLV